VRPPTDPLLYSVLLFLGMLALLEIGRRLAVRLHRGEPEEAKYLDTVETAVFALFGLLIAFTFSGAALRFQEKRMLVAEEANAIGTAYLRVDLVAAPAQAELRQWFREYVDSRLETYRRLPNLETAGVEIAKSKKLQGDIWTASVAASRLADSHPSTALLLLPALNSMIDITTTRAMALQSHPPQIIYWLLFGLGLLCSLLAGYRMTTRPQRGWLHVVVFPLVTVVVVYVTLDVEYPRSGLIRVSNADQALVEVRAGMK
jgi:hypothetical protein